MANIFGGISLNPPAQVGGGDDLTSNFIAGMRSRREDEDFKMRQAQEARAQIQHNIAVQEAQVRMAKTAAEYNAFSFKNAMEMKAYEALPQAMAAFTAVRDWANPVEWNNFIAANPNASLLPIANQAIENSQNALQYKARLDQIQEINRGKLEAIDAKPFGGVKPIAAEIKFQRLQAARESGDQDAIAYWERVTQGRDIPIVEKMNRLRSLENDPNADPDEVLALRMDVGLEMSRSDRTNIEDQIANYDASIESFEALASGGKLSNETVGPISRALGGFDFLTGLMGQDIYEFFGGKAREEVKTRIKSLVARNTRSLIDEPGGVLSNSDKQQARDIISADNFLSTPQRAKVELKTLATIMRMGRERAKQRLGISATTQSNASSLRKEAEAAIARGASRDAVARRFKEQTGQDF